MWNTLSFSVWKRRQFHFRQAPSFRSLSVKIADRKKSTSSPTNVILMQTLKFLLWNRTTITTSRNSLSPMFGIQNPDLLLFFFLSPSPISILALHTTCIRERHTWGDSVVRIQYAVGVGGTTILICFCCDFASATYQLGVFRGTGNVLLCRVNANICA